MDNIIPMKPREKSHHEKLTEILGTESYLVFYPSAHGLLAWRVGDPMNVEKLTFVRAVLDQMIHEEMQKLMRKDLK